MLYTQSRTFIRKFSLKTLMATLSVVLLGCNNTGSSGTNSVNPTSTDMSLATTQISEKKQITPSKFNSFYLANVGAAYDSSTNTATSGQSCLVATSNPNNITVTSPSAILTFDQEQDFNALQSALGVSFNTKISGGMFSTSLAAQYANNAQNTHYVTNLIYLYQYAGTATFVQGTVGGGYKALMPIAAALAESHPTEFREMCGDEFVDGMDAGALLAVTLKLSFNSYMDQQKFAGSLKAKVGLVGVGAAIQQAATNSDVHVGMTMSAIQFGGDPQRLNNLFGKPVASGNYPYLDCGSVGGLQANACNQMIDSIITYAETLGDQLSNRDGSIKTSSLFYNNPTLTKYQAIGVKVGAPDPESGVINAMERITLGYDKAKYDYNFVSHYLISLAGFLDSPTQETLKGAQSRLNAQLANVYENSVYDILDCYRGYVTENCLTIEANVNHALKPLQLSSQQADLIKYLETNSYSAKLYEYTGGSQLESTSYQLTPQDCIIAPISSPLNAQYAINCNSLWLNVLTPTGLIISPGHGSITVDGLSYMSESIVGNTVYEQPITYQNSTLYVDPYYSNYFTGNNIEVLSGSLIITPAGTIGLTKWFENQA